MDKELVPFSENPYDWDKAVKIVSKPSSKYKDMDCLGYYSESDKEIFIDLDRQRETLASTISHEISHQKLGHKDSYDMDRIERRLGSVWNISLGKGTLGSYGRFSRLQDLLSELEELEVRMFQEIHGYALEVEDTFYRYL